MIIQKSNLAQRYALKNNDLLKKNDFGSGTVVLQNKIIDRMTKPYNLGYVPQKREHYQIPTSRYNAISCRYTLLRSALNWKDLLLL